MDHGVLGTASAPSLEQNMGGSIIPKQGSGYPGKLHGGGVASPSSHSG